VFELIIVAFILARFSAAHCIRLKHLFTVRFEDFTALKIQVEVF